jgi:murein DD-endopeptidase MepM/ murein hydrolase activator NlpD
MPQDPQRAKLIHRLRKPILIALPLALALAWFWPGSPKSPKTLPHRTDLKAHATPNNAAKKTINKQPWHQATVQHGETLSHLFKKNQLSSATLMRLLANADIKKNLNQLKPGQPIAWQTNTEGKLSQLKIRTQPGKNLLITATPQGFKAQQEILTPDTRLVYLHGTIQQSLTQDAMEAGMNNQQASQLGRIFQWRIQLKRQLRKGDTFAVLLQQDHYPTQKAAPGRIVFAHLSTHRGTWDAIRFGQPTAFYTPQGASLSNAMTRIPLHYIYVSSPFSLHRMHPILHRIRPHLGVDLAAPTGQPVHAGANGTVTFAGQEHGYGNVLKIRYPDHYSAVYAHLSRFKQGIHRRSQVKRGQVIAYVGCTGLCTGPHLHYEIHYRGTPYNPMTIKLPTARPVPPAQHMAFEQYTVMLQKQARLKQNTQWAQAKQPQGYA